MYDLWESVERELGCLLGSGLHHLRRGLVFWRFGLGSLGEAAFEYFGILGLINICNSGYSSCHNFVQIGLGRITSRRIVLLISCRIISLPMPLHRSLHLILHQLLHQIGTHYVLSKPLFLQQLEVLERRARVRQVFQVRRFRPVLQVGEVGDKGGLCEELLRREVVEVQWVCEGLNKLGRLVSFCTFRKQPYLQQVVDMGHTSSSISKRE